MRTLLFDGEGKQKPDFGSQVAYSITATPDGGVEVDAEELAHLCLQTLSSLHGQMKDHNLRPAGVAISAFWHSFVGVDLTGKPTTPIIHLFDTRSTEQVKELEGILDPKQVYARTGCRLHTSYWPAKLLWLYKYRTDAFAATNFWISFGEFLLLKLFGTAVSSTSMVSGSGLWKQAENDYDEQILLSLPIRREQLCPPTRMDEPVSELKEEYRSRFPLFDGVPWYPALGDGACNNVGSGCTRSNIFSLMVGTSGAMRAVISEQHFELPDGLWCYRVDRKRYIMGGALSNGGEVYAWMRRVLNLPAEAETERLLQEMDPGAHGLVLLPFFAGERSPYWRADLRAAVTGMNLATRPIDLLRAALESVALRFREILILMTSQLGTPTQIVASGGALLHSRAWTQMMADALGLPVSISAEQEASSRGAALLALERLGLLEIERLEVETNGVVEPRADHAGAYTALLAEQRRVFNQLFMEK